VGKRVISSPSFIVKKQRTREGVRSRGPVDSLNHSVVPGIGQGERNDSTRPRDVPRDSITEKKAAQGKKRESIPAIGYRVGRKKDRGETGALTCEVSEARLHQFALAGSEKNGQEG